MKKYNFKNQTGSLKIIIIAGVGLAMLAALAGGIYLMTKNKSQVKAPEGQAEQAPAAVQDITVDSPDLDFKLSPMPTLSVSSISLSAPALPGSRMFPNFSVNTDFSYTGDTTIDEPTVNFDVPVPPQIKNPPVIPTAPTQPTQPTAPTQPTPPTQPTAPTADCGQFAAVPSCSMVGAPGTPGYTACKTCFPNK